MHQDVKTFVIVLVAVIAADYLNKKVLKIA